MVGVSTTAILVLVGNTATPLRRLDQQASVSPATTVHPQTIFGTLDLRPIVAPQAFIVWMILQTRYPVHREPTSRANKKAYA